MSSNISRDTYIFFSNCKSEELWYPPVFFENGLHGGGHLELKKMHKGDFWGIFGIRLGRCPCIIPEKISFLQFYSRFNPNALALLVVSAENMGSGGRGGGSTLVNVEYQIHMFSQFRAIFMQNFVHKMGITTHPSV